MEVHAQLQTESKIFCRCRAQFGAKENSQVCPVCSGMPGALPALNRKAVEFAIKMGVATHCEIAPYSLFARKNYFYPDLPKGYQISQYEQPLCRDGYIEIESDKTVKKVGITRIHLEEDAGKSIHAESWLSKNETVVDLNRCGVPLIEIVSKPELTSPREAYLYLTSIKRLLRYLEICDGNMEQASLRCDANISVRRIGQKEPGIRTELKNMNSFHGVEKALTYEIDRQIQILTSGGTIRQQTLLWDANKNRAITMRTKEESPDYRYFPEPDLVPLNLDHSWIDEIGADLPELPSQRKSRFMSQYQIAEYDANILTEDKMIADYYERVVQSVSDPKLVSHWILGEILHLMKKPQELSRFQISETDLAELLNFIVKGIISEKMAKDILKEMILTKKSARDIINENQLQQISDAEKLSPIISEVIEAHPDEVIKYQAGKTRVLGFLVGQVMQKSQGRANPHLVNKLLREKLSSL